MPLTPAAARSEDVSGGVSVISTWSGPEQASFEEVIAGFEEQYPDVDVSYDSAGDALPTVLSTAVEGGNPPDVAVVAQPGLIQGYVERGAASSRSTSPRRRSPRTSATRHPGRHRRQLYALLFKAANKSTVWYNVQAFEDAGVEAADNWDDFLANAETIKAPAALRVLDRRRRGLDPHRPLREHLSPHRRRDMYDQLSRHEIPWTDQSVKDALTEMAKIVGDADNIAGGTQAALQNDFPTSVSNVFAEEPKAAMVIEGDFVPGVVESPLEPETGYNVFPFPAINDSPPSVVGGGDLAIMFNDTPASQAFIEYLADPGGGRDLGRPGRVLVGQPEPGFRRLLGSDHGDDRDRDCRGGGVPLRHVRLAAVRVRQHGGQDLPKIFQDFVANPDDIDGTAQQLTAAAAAYGE